MKVIIEFLKPDWGKFIIPLIFIIIFSTFVSWFFAVTKIIDKYGCEMTSLYGELKTNREQFFKTNDSFALNETIDKIKYLQNQMNEEIDSSVFLFKDMDDVKTIYDFIVKIDPLFPVSCEFSGEKNCRHYTSEETFQCFNKLQETERGIISDLITFQSYKKLSIFDVLINILILFFEGYFLSCFIIWVYDKVKKR